MPTLKFPCCGLGSSRSIVAMLGLLPLALSGCLVDELENVKDPVDADGDGFTEDVDCNDRHPAIHPDAQEICDGDPLTGLGEVDNNCNGLAGDEDPTLNRGGLAGTWYRDADGDGYGDRSGQPGARISGCVKPDGYVEESDDCDDTNSSVQPESREICGDDIDNDCDGSVDVITDDAANLNMPAWFQDLDGDGYGNQFVSLRSCSRPIGEGDERWVAPKLLPSDAIGVDGVSISDWSNGEVDIADLPDTAFDCDDNEAGVNPGVPEDCEPVDRNCDGFLYDGAEGADAFWDDGDGDGFGDPETVQLACSPPAGFVGAADAAPDCDDTNIFVKPGAPDPGGQSCDGLDNDCDGVADNDSGRGTLHLWCRDSDDDDYPNQAQCVEAFCQPDREVLPRSDQVYVGVEFAFPGLTPAQWSDCDDTDPDTHPDADERCDAIDNNCNGSIDELGATDAPARFLDVDGDGYGDDAAPTVAECLVPPGYASIGGDCGPSDPGVNPGADDICNNGLSEDCADDDGCLMVGAYTASVSTLGASDGIVGNPWALLRGTDLSGMAGATVAGGGDLDGDPDGLSELLVYAPLTGNGRLFVVNQRAPASGVTTLSAATTGTVITGTATDALGFDVVTAATLIGGGGDDLVVGAPGAGGVGTVAIYSWPLTTTALSVGLADAQVRITGPVGRAGFGAQLSVADLNGDGARDLVVGAARRTDTGLSGASAGAWVVYGPFGVGASGVEGMSSTELSGSVVAVGGVGDLDNDGIDDLVFADATGFALVYGDAARLPDCAASVDCADRRLTIGSTFSTYSSQPVQIEALGDVNGDGSDDFAVGVPYADTLASGDEGEVAVYLGGSAAGASTLAADLSIVGAEAGGRAGASISGGLDLDLDGTADFAVGSPGDSAPLGAVYLFYGADLARGATYEVYAARSFILGDATAPGVGMSVALLEDALGDGTPDVAVGVPSLSSNVGGVFLFGQTD